MIKTVADEISWRERLTWFDYLSDRPMTAALGSLLLVYEVMDRWPEGAVLPETLWETSEHFVEKTAWTQDKAMVKKSWCWIFSFIQIKLSKHNASRSGFQRLCHTLAAGHLFFQGFITLVNVYTTKTKQYRVLFKDACNRYLHTIFIVHHTHTTPVSKITLVT